MSENVNGVPLYHLTLSSTVAKAVHSQGPFSGKLAHVNMAEVSYKTKPHVVQDRLELTLGRQSQHGRPALILDLAVLVNAD